MKVTGLIPMKSLDIGIYYRTTLFDMAGEIYGLVTLFVIDIQSLIFLKIKATRRQYKAKNVQLKWLLNDHQKLRNILILFD